MKKKRLTERERESLLAREMVYQAVRDLQLRGEATPKERRESRAWLFSDSKAKGSFLRCCETAGLTPADVRAEVKKREAK